MKFDKIFDSNYLAELSDVIIRETVNGYEMYREYEIHRLDSVFQVNNSRYNLKKLFGSMRTAASWVTHDYFRSYRSCHEIEFLDLRLSDLEFQRSNLELLIKRESLDRRIIAGKIPEVEYQIRRLKSELNKYQERSRLLQLRHFSRTRINT